MEFIRTPDDRFKNLLDYPFKPNYVDVDDTEGGKLRMHFVDEGPKDGQTVVMIHGNPTWSYMWRKLIPVLVSNGYRAVAIDHIGAGRSDKPTKMGDYTIARHEAWVKQALLKRSVLKTRTLFCMIGAELSGFAPSLIIRTRSVPSSCRIRVWHTEIPTKL